MTPLPPPGSPMLRWICAVILVLTLGGFFAGPAVGIPTWAISVAAAAALCVVHAAASREGLTPIFKGVGWDVLIFLCGMFVVGLGLRQAGLTREIGDLIQRLSGGDYARMRLSTGL